MKSRDCGTLKGKEWSHRDLFSFSNVQIAKTPAGLRHTGSYPVRRLTRKNVWARLSFQEFVLTNRNTVRSPYTTS